MRDDEMNVSIDDLDRLEHILDIVIEMHDSYGIGIEEAAGRFDRYAQKAMRFIKSDMFFHASSEQLAQFIYYGTWVREPIGQGLPTPVPFP